MAAPRLAKGSLCRLHNRGAVGRATGAGVPVERPRDGPEPRVVVAPVALEVATDDDDGDRARPGALQRGGGALGVRSRGPGVVDEQHALAVETCEPGELLRVELVQ